MSDDGIQKDVLSLRFKFEVLPGRRGREIHTQTMATDLASDDALRIVCFERVEARADDTPVDFINSH
jgi:hypothetical protein